MTTYHYTVQRMTPTESGGYRLASDMLPDMMDGEPLANWEDLLQHMLDAGYKQAFGYFGWGLVMEHRESGELVSIQPNGTMSIAEHIDPSATLRGMTLAEARKAIEAQLRVFREDLDYFSDRDIERYLKSLQPA